MFRQRSGVWEHRVTRVRSRVRWRSCDAPCCELGRRCCYLHCFRRLQPHSNYRRATATSQKSLSQKRVGCRRLSGPLPMIPGRWARPPKPHRDCASWHSRKGLKHPRWLQVLPNGDVLVAEAASEPAKSWWPRTIVQNMVQRRSGSIVENANRISLLRDAEC